VDFNGKLLRSVQLEAGSHSLNVSDLPKGVYLARFHSQGKIWVEKLVVQR